MYIAGFRFQLEYAKSERSQRRNPNDAGGLFLKYDIRGQIGSGSFARVHRAVCKKTGEWSAVKIIDKKRFKHNAKTMFMLQREVSIMQALDNVRTARWLVTKQTRALNLTKLLFAALYCQVLRRIRR